MYEAESGTNHSCKSRHNSQGRQIKAERETSRRINALYRTAMRIEVFVQAQRVPDVPGERVDAIEPSRRPEASPCFRGTAGLEQQGFAPRDRGQVSSRFLAQDPVEHFFNARATSPIHAPAGHRPPSRRGRSLSSSVPCV